MPAMPARPRGDAPKVTHLRPGASPRSFCPCWRARRGTLPMASAVRQGDPDRVSRASSGTDPCPERSMSGEFRTPREATSLEELTPPPPKGGGFMSAPAD
jgi:hypothetical protein